MFGERPDLGICTQWQNPENWKVFDPKDYGVLGPLYSPAGVIPMARNCLLAPEIRSIVLCGGSSFNKSGEALRLLLEKGTDEEGCIKGFDLYGRKIPIVSELPAEAIEIFRGRVTLHDWRSISLQDVAKNLNTIERQAPKGEAITYPKNETVIPFLESEKTGFTLYAKNLSDLWVKVLQQVYLFGTEKPVSGITTREYVNVQAVLLSNNTVDYSKIPAWTGLTRGFMEDYETEILSGVVPEGKKYTYGNRMFSWGTEGINQIENVINLLKQDSNSRRAVVSLYDNRIDITSSNPPCLTEVVFLSQNKQLFMTCRFRSHDIGSAWLANTFALRKLQEVVAERANLKIGNMVISSHSAHIYERDFEMAKKMIEVNKRRLDSQLTMDPRGNMVISTDREKGIIAMHFDPITGSHTGYVFSSDNPGVLAQEIARSGLVMGESHMAYITSEIWKAYHASVSGKIYTQDH